MEKHVRDDLAVLPEPFKIQVHQESGKIILQGDLNGSEEASGKIQKAFSNASRTGRTEWIVEAGEAAIVFGGIKTWIMLVHKYLMECKLTYTPSQLCLILANLGDEYKHPNSYLPEED